MKKGILFITLIFLLTGCTINYDLEFDGNKIIENISGTVTNEEISSEDESTGEEEEGKDVNIYRDLLYDPQQVFNGKDEFYVTSTTPGEDVVNYNFNYTYLDNYKNSRLLERCFDYSLITETSELYDIKLTGFSCLFSDKITVNIKSNYAVINSNAAKVKDNIYTWVIEEEKDGDISITISKKLKYRKEESQGVSMFKIIGLIVLVVLSLITYFLYRKKNKNNET